MRAGVVVFPGSNCDDDTLHVLQDVCGQEARFVWHKDSDLSGLDAVVLPGGFSYGDYLRTGAIARFSPVMRAVSEFAARGGPVLGICNGFQILQEAGLLPGAMLRNRDVKFLSQPVHVRVERDDTLVTTGVPRGTVLTMPIAHGEGNFYLPPDELQRLEDEGRVVFRYCDGRRPPRGRGQRQRQRGRGGRGVQRPSQRGRPHAPPGARLGEPPRLRGRPPDLRGPGGRRLARRRLIPLSPIVPCSHPPGVRGAYPLCIRVSSKEESMSRLRVTCVLTGIALAATATLTLAQTGTEKKAAEAPKPAPEIATLKAFDGNWTCHGDAPASPFGPAHKYTSTVQSHLGMNGFWQSGTIKMPPVAGMPGMQGMYHMTYEPGAKEYVMLWVDDMGGFSKMTSSGWEGDKITFTGEGTMGGQKMMGRDSFTKKADGSLLHTGEMQMDGKWVSMGDETCRKPAAAPAKK